MSRSGILRPPALVTALAFVLAGAMPVLADDDDYERGPKVKVDDDGKEYKYEYEGRRCKYKYELKYRTGEEKVERKGDCHGVGPHRVVYYSDGSPLRHERESEGHYDDQDDSDYDRGSKGLAGRLSCQREVIGQMLGGVAGGVLGAQVGDGSGKRAATIAGTIVGVMIGGSVGRRMDRADTACAYQALEFADPGQSVFWRNPESHMEYRIIPERQARRADGRHCRTYRAFVSGPGLTERQTEGTGCRRFDGAWEIVSR